MAVFTTATRAAGVTAFVPRRAATATTQSDEVVEHGIRTSFTGIVVRLAVRIFSRASDTGSAGTAGTDGDCIGLTGNNRVRVHGHDAATATTSAGSPTSTSTAADDQDFRQASLRRRVCVRTDRFHRHHDR